MIDSIEKQAMTEVPGILAKLIDLPEKDVFVVSQERNTGLDFIVKSADYHFQVECKNSSSRAPLLMALRQITEFRNSFDEDDIPLIVMSGIWLGHKWVAS
jgi:hypothetical protein